MKTKHLLTGLVLPAVLAACTSEDIVSQQEVANVELGNRPVVGNVVLNFGEAESRGTIADREFNSIDFVEGEDGFGARIIDVYNKNWGNKDHQAVPQGATLDHAWRNYEIKNDFASSNYKYVNNGGTSWSTCALMVEGNYLFYYPYNEANLARTPNKVVLPMTQVVVPGEENGYRNPIKDLYEGETPAIVGYAFLSATEQDPVVSPTLNHVFAYPQFTIKNEQTKRLSWNKTEGVDMIIEKIVVESTNFTKNYEINHTGIDNSLRDFALTQQKKGSQVWANAVAAGTWTDYKKFLKNAKTTDILTKKEDALVDGKIEVVFDGGLYLAYGEEYSFNLVMPAAAYDDEENLKFTIYLADNKQIDGAQCVDKNNYNYLTYAPGKRYPAEEYNFPTNGTPSVKNSAGTLGTITLKNETIVDKTTPAQIIDNAEEFEAFLASIVDNTTPLKEVKELSTRMGENEFVLARNASTDIASMKIDAAVVELINTYLNGGSVEFYSKMQVEDAEEAVVLNKMTFNAGFDVLAGEVSALNATADNVTVSGGVLTIPADATGALKNIKVEGGEVVVNKDGFVDNNVANVYVTKKVVNGTTVSTGKLTIDTEAANTNLNNVKMDAGEVVIAEESTAWYTSATTNITAGKITVDGVLYVYDNATIAAGVTVDLNGEVTGAGALTNKGTINNYSDLTVINEGTVNMKTRTATLIASSTADVVGNIDNTILAYVEVTGGNRDAQNVWYVFEEDVDFTTATAIKYYKYAINALTIKGKTFTIDGTAEEYAAIKAAYNATTGEVLDESGLGWINTVKLTDGAKVWADGAQTVGMTKFIVEGTVEMSGFGLNSSIEFVNTAEVKMALNSKLTVKSGLTLKAATASEKINFVGTEVTPNNTMAKLVNNGVITGATKDSNIDYSGNGSFN